MAEVAGPAPRLSIAQRASLMAEIGRAYLVVRRLSARERLPAVVDALRREPATAAAPLPDPRIDGRRLGSAVTRALVLAPGGTKCLLRSLVLTRMLARRGVVDAQLIIAVLPGPAVLDAHAWVELDGRPLLPPGGERERLLVL